MQLTEHQRTVLKLLRTGVSTRKAADALGVSYWSVKRVVQSTCKKYNADNLASLVNIIKNIDLDRPSQAKKSTGIFLSEHNTWIVYVYVRRKTLYCGSYAKRADALAASARAKEMAASGKSMDEIRSVLALPRARKHGCIYKISSGTWRARLCVGGKYVNLGYYLDRTKAEKIIADAAALKAKGFDASSIKARLLEA